MSDDAKGPVITSYVSDKVHGGNREGDPTDNAPLMALARKSLAGYVSKAVYEGKRELTPTQLARAQETVRLAKEVERGSKK
jgi:hypothetical protein